MKPPLTMRDNRSLCLKLLPLLICPNLTSTLSGSTAK